MIVIRHHSRVKETTWAFFEIREQLLDCQPVWWYTSAGKSGSFGPNANYNRTISIRHFLNGWELKNTYPMSQATSESLLFYHIGWCASVNRFFCANMLSYCLVVFIVENVFIVCLPLCGWRVPVAIVVTHSTHLPWPAYRFVRESCGNQQAK